MSLIALDMDTLAMARDAMESQHGDLDDRRDQYDSTEEWEEHQESIWAANRKLQAFLGAMEAINIDSVHIEPRGNRFFSVGFGSIEIGRGEG